MIDAIREVYRWLPSWAHFIWNTVFVLVILKVVVTKDVAYWLEKRGWIRTKENGLIFKTLDFIYFGARAALRLLFIPTQRKRVIWTHHKEQHPAKSITGCDLETCQTI